MVNYRKADAAFDADVAAAAVSGASLRVKMPDKKEGELFGIADALVGGSRLEVMCEDGVKRLARIPGKMKRRMWIREGDLVTVRYRSTEPASSEEGSSSRGGEATSGNQRPNGDSKGGDDDGANVSGCSAMRVQADGAPVIALSLLMLGLVRIRRRG